MRDSLIAHDDLHTADSAHACARLGIYSDHMARQGRRYGTYAMAAGMLQGLQALSARQWPPLGAFIKLPALRVVHDSGVPTDDRGPHPVSPMVSCMAASRQLSLPQRQRFQTKW